MCYNKSSRHSSAQLAEYRKAWTGEKLDMIIEDMPNIVTKVNIANEPEEILLDERTTDN